MPNLARRRSYRPLMETFERRDVPTVGFAVSMFSSVMRTVGGLRTVQSPDPFAKTAVIDRSRLQRGDILVSTEDSLVSGLIRDVTASAYSHASVYIGDGKIIDATGDGIRMRNLSTLTKPALRVSVIRANGLTSSQQDQIVAEAKKYVGQKYNSRGLIEGLAPHLFGISHFGIKAYRAINGRSTRITGTTNGVGYFCSQLVIKAYDSAGVKIAAEAGDTPGGIIIFAKDRPSEFQLVGRIVASARPMVLAGMRLWD